MLNPDKPNLVGHLLLGSGPDQNLPAITTLDLPLGPNEVFRLVAETIDGQQAEILFPLPQFQAAFNQLMQVNQRKLREQAQQAAVQ